jgi:hypothetical protein
MLPLHHGGGPIGVLTEFHAIAGLGGGIEHIGVSHGTAQVLELSRTRVEGHYSS